MDFSLTEEQIGMQKMAKDYAKDKIEPLAAEYDEKDEVPMGLLTDMVLQGFSTMTIPQEYGGSGLDEVTACLVVEELAKGCAGITTGATANSLAAYPILVAGTEEQKKKYLAPLSEGKFAAFCLTEPGAGSDAAAIATVAKKEGDEYIINGNKCFITNAGFADIYTVFATVDKSKGLKGLTAFIIEKGTPGLSVGKKEKKMGIRASNTSEVIFEDVRIPLANRLGEEGEGFKIAMRTLDLSRPLVGAMAIGVARAAYEAAIKYAKEREQFGRPIAQFQAIQFKLADMAIKIDGARLLVLRAAYLASKKEKRISRESAIAKASAGDVAMEVTIEALQIYGGYGYSREYPLEKYMRDAKIMQIYEGTSEIQRIVIAQNILR